MYICFRGGSRRCGDGGSSKEDGRAPTCTFFTYSNKELTFDNSLDLFAFIHSSGWLFFILTFRL